MPTYGTYGGGGGSLGTGTYSSSPVVNPNPYGGYRGDPRSTGLGLRYPIQDGRYGAPTGGSYAGGYGGYGGISGDPQRDALDARRKVERLFKKRVRGLSKDPYTSAALGRLKAITEGRDAPISPQIENMLANRAAEMAAGAESAQNRMLREGMAAGGGSVTDPSYQAAIRRNLGERQAQNIQSRRDIGIEAAQRNFAARQSGAGQLAASNTAWQNMFQRPFDRLTDFYTASEFADRFNRYGGGGGAGMGAGDPRYAWDQPQYTSYADSRSINPYQPIGFRRPDSGGEDPFAAQRAGAGEATYTPPRTWSPPRLSGGNVYRRGTGEAGSGRINRPGRYGTGYMG